MSVTDSLKQSVQELQRDITLRRSLTREITVNELRAQITSTEERLEKHFSNMEAKQPCLEKVFCKPRFFLRILVLNLFFRK